MRWPHQFACEVFHDPLVYEGLGDQRLGLALCQFELGILKIQYALSKRFAFFYKINSQRQRALHIYRRLGM